jgi:hypothetical protein
MVAPTLDDFDESLCCELHERFAHRCNADSETLGEALRIETVTLLELPPHDEVEHGTAHGLGEGRSRAPEKLAVVLHAVRSE